MNAMKRLRHLHPGDAFLHEGRLWVVNYEAGWGDRLCCILVGSGGGYLPADCAVEPVDLPDLPSRAATLEAVVHDLREELAGRGVVRPGGRCAWEGCRAVATRVAAGRPVAYRPGHLDPAGYCPAHAHCVAHEGQPERTVDCPNCGCAFGVG